MSKITTTLVQHIADLAKIPISATEAEKLATAFTDTLKVVDNLQELDVTKVEPTHQVTGLENIWRADEIEAEKMLTQDEALRNATKTHAGFFVVPHLLENKE